MTPKIFLTGVTGYIGGEAFYNIYNAHPDFEYALLVRNEERGKLVLENYPIKENPNLRLVYGSLDDSEVIQKEASHADIVVHTADSSDDEPSCQAILAGLSRTHASDQPGYWIHVSGTSLLTWYDINEKRYAQAPLPEQSYHDITDIEKITRGLPDEAPHRPIDKLVLSANDGGNVRTLIVCPPTIYGTGRGPVNQRSMQVPGMARRTLAHGFAPVVDPGLAEWDHVHVRDLGHFLRLAVDAALDPQLRADPHVFGAEGYYFLENGKHVWSEVAQWIADEAKAQGLIEKAETRSVSVEEVGFPSWVFNSHGTAARARKYLAWEPKGEDLKATISEVVKIEAGKLQQK